MRGSQKQKDKIYLHKKKKKIFFTCKRAVFCNVIFPLGGHEIQAAALLNPARGEGDLGMSLKGSLWKFSCKWQ